MSEASSDPDGYALVGAQFEELAAALRQEGGGPPDPERITKLAAKAVPHSAHCGVTLLRGRSRPTAVAATDELPPRVDEMQYETGEGPCLSASEDNDTYWVDDLTIDQQWPIFARRCVAETEVRSMFSIQLHLQGDDRAAINFYGQKAGAFDELDMGTGAIFGPFVAMALQSQLREQESSHLRTALQGSREIGIAVGILMARKLLTSEEAFEQLRQSSQNLNRKLRDIAAEVEWTGELP